MRTPSWDEFREFLRYDQWEEDRATGHDFFEKTVPDGEIVRTHASRSGSKTMSPGRFKAILLERKAGLTREQIAELDEAEARRLLLEARSRSVE